jgi:hypothetical protein
MKHAHAWNWDEKGGRNFSYKHNQQKPSARALLQRDGKNFMKPYNIYH